MSSMADRFDPYHKWLGISAKDQPPHYYRLLGIDLFEADLDVIDTAANQRMVYLRECAQGENGDLAEKLLSEVASARLCLLDPYKKGMYDQRLQFSQAAPAASYAPASAELPLIAVSPQFEEPLSFSTTYSPPSSRVVRRKRGPSRVSVILGTVLGGPTGLAVGYLVLCLIGPQYDFLHLWHVPAPQIAQAPAVARIPPVDDAPQESPTRIEEPTIEESPPPANASPSPLDKEKGAHDAESQRDVKPDPEQAADPPPEPVDPFRELPTAICLSNTNGGQKVTIGALDVPAEASVSLVLVNPKLLDLTYRFELEEDARVPDAGVIKWQMDAIPHDPRAEIRSVGRFSLKGQTLHFEWTEKVDKPIASALENCILRVQVRDAVRNIPLREPVEVPAIVLDFEKKIPGTPFDPEGLPDAIKKILVLEVGSVEGILTDDMAVLEESRPNKKATVVAIDKGKPQMQLRVRFEGGKSVCPEIMLVDGAAPEQFVDLKKMRTALSKQRLDTRGRIENLDIDIKQAVRRLDQDPKDGIKIQRTITELKNEVQERSKQLVDLDAKFNHLQSLSDLAANLSGKAKLHVRLYYTCEGTKVDVWRAGDTFFSLATARPIDVSDQKLHKVKGPTSFVQSRRPEWRGELLEKYGGDQQTEYAVYNALQWLANHQHPNGSWSFDHRTGICPTCDNQGELKQTAGIAATAIALLPFLGTGQTHLQGKYKHNVATGLDYLVNRMQIGPDGGDLSYENGDMYGHGLATTALSEAYGMTRDRALVEPAQLSVNFIVNAQDPGGGGWRYKAQRKEPGDTSVVGWQLMALTSAQMANLFVPRETINGGIAFLTSVQKDDGAAYGYLNSGDGGPATTAIGLLLRMFVDGWELENPALRRGVDSLARQGPAPSNIYFNYYATELLMQYGGEHWTQWNTKVREVLLRSQATKDHEAGSWYIGGDQFSSPGGRLYYTSLAALILESYYRYPRLYQEPAALPVRQSVSAPEHVPDMPTN
jgi:hypothetical protein